MEIRVFFSSHLRRVGEWLPALKAACAKTGVEINLTTQPDNPESIDYIIYSPDGPLRDFSPFVNLKAVLSLWAGVETIVGNKTIQAPLTRMVDSSMVEAMQAWVTGQVLRHHLGFDYHIRAQDGVWRSDLLPPLARHRRIGMIGLGELGSACARMLAALGFKVTGWSRSPKQIVGIECVTGETGLQKALCSTDIIVLLLPLTGETENLLSRGRLKRIKRGGIIINCGRGGLVDEDALLEAVDSGHIAHATLDVFRQEPLPPDHPFWSHSRVSVWPHISSETYPETAAAIIAENIRRGESGEPLLYLVDRGRGY